MAERKIKVAFSSVVRRTVPVMGISFVLSTFIWKLTPLTPPFQLLSVAASAMLLLFLLQLRFSPHMTVAAWSRLWGSLAPVFAGSLVSLPYFPFVPLLLCLLVVTLILGLWAAYRFYPLLHDPRLHRARFARLDEMETLLARQPCSDGLVIGRVKQFYFLHQYVCIRPTRVKKEIGNSLIIAPTGGGKGNQIRGQIVAWEESMIINDPKGDLFLSTAGYRSQLGPVYVIDPTRGVGHCYDPLSGRTEEGEYLTVAKHLMFDAQDGEPYWAENASKMMLFLFQAARREGIAPLPYLRHMIRLGLQNTARRLNSIDPALATAFLDADLETAHLESNRTLTSAWSTLTTRLTPFLTETLVRCFTGSEVSAGAIMRGPRPVTVYFRLEEAHLERLAPFVRILVESLVKELISTWDRFQGQGCRRVLLSLDELGVTPVPSLAKYVATARSRDIIFQLYYQSLAQIVDNYGPEKAKSLISNMDTTVFLRPNDHETAQNIEEWLGRGSQFSQSHNFREGSEFSEGLSEQAIPVMTAREIMEMPDSYALVFHRDLPPMKIHRLKWWQSKLLRERHNLPVPVLQPLPDIPPLPAGEPGQQASSSIQFVDPDQVRGRQVIQQAEVTDRTAARETTILDFSRPSQKPNLPLDLQR
jgi:type IV secretion system protein VirD4